MARSRVTHQLAGEQAIILPAGVLAVPMEIFIGEVLAGDRVVLDNRWLKFVVSATGPLVLVKGDPLDELRRFIDKADWVAARSDTNPHEYVVEHRQGNPVEGGPLFDLMCAAILRGRYRQWGSRPWTYRQITVDEYDYWLTWVGDWDCGRIINRKLTVDAGWLN